MRKLFGCLLVLFLTPLAFAQANGTVVLTSDSWTVTADPQRTTLQVSYANLGNLLNDLRLTVKTDSQLQPLSHWTIERISPNQINIRTSDPQLGWSIFLAPNLLKISSTSQSALITANLPVSPKRFVARLLDTEGAPVNWVGTKEVKETYGAPEVRNPSNLPSQNPDVMYFSLGQIASPLFHSLFDQSTDTAITFPPDALLEYSVADRSALSLSMPVPGNAVIRITPDYYTKTLHLPFYVPFDDTYFKSAPMVWSSWTSYYEDVSENDMLRNADWLASYLKPYGFQYVELDDGYDRAAQGQHSWIEGWNKSKFPHGPEWLTRYIKDRGLQAGIWLVPNAYAGAVETHPDWYLHYQTGKIVLDYNTPALDSTNPQALDFVQKIFTTLDDWGFEYYKFDGEHAATKIIPGLDLSRIHDPSIDPTLAYRHRLERIRATIGPKRFIEVCPAGSPLDGIGFVNSYFNGHDLYDNWQGMYSLFGSISGNAFLNHVAVYVMPGEGMALGPSMTVQEAQSKRSPIVLDTARQREDPLTGFGVSDAEARTILSHVSLTGVAYALASVMPELPAARVKMLQMTLPTRPIIPIDLFSRGSDVEWDTFKHVQPQFYIHNFPEILDLKINANSEDYDVVAITNWRDTKTSQSLSLARKFGLDPRATYLAFDFWNQQFAGQSQADISLSLDPHDTKVLFLHKLTTHPQWLGSSRHITGEFSISNLAWNASTKSLSGSSELIPKDPYTLWFYVPDGFHVQAVSTVPGIGHDLKIKQSLQNHILSITFDSPLKSIDWTIQFTAAATN